MRPFRGVKPSRWLWWSMCSNISVAPVFCSFLLADFTSNFNHFPGSPGRPKPPGELGDR